MANFLISTAGTTIEGSTDADIVEFITGGSSTTVKGKDGDDILRASAVGLQGITFFGNTGADVVSALGQDVLDSNLQLGRGNDSAIIGNNADVGSSTIKGKLGNDVITFAGLSAGSTASSVAFRGNQGDDTISVSGGNLDNIIVAGGAGADTLTFSAQSLISAGAIAAGLGQDTVLVSGGSIDELDIRLHSDAKSADLDSADTLTLTNVNYTTASINGGGGADVLRFNGGTWSEITVRGGLGNDTAAISGTYTTSDFAFGKGADTITISGDASFSSNTINGGQGDDSFDLNSVTGNTLIGGLGADTFTGNGLAITGNTYFFNTATESTLTSMDIINNGGLGLTGGLTFGFNTANNVSTVSGTFTGAAYGSLAQTINVQSGVYTFSTADFDNSVGATAAVTAAVELLNTALTTNGQAIFFNFSGAMSGGAGAGSGEGFLFVQRGDDDLVVNVEDYESTGESLIDAYTLSANNGGTVNTLSFEAG